MGFNVITPPGGVNGFQNFLQQGGFAAYNLAPDETGVVSLKCGLGSYTGLFAIALD